MEQVDLRQGLTASFPERLSQLSSPSRLGRYDQVWPVLVQLHHRVTRHFVLVKYLHHLGILSFTNPETNPFPHLNLMFWNWFPDPNHKWSIFIEQYWTLIGCSSSSPPPPKTTISQLFYRLTNLKTKTKNIIQQIYHKTYSNRQKFKRIGIRSYS